MALTRLAAITALWNPVQHIATTPAVYRTLGQQPRHLWQATSILSTSISIPAISINLPGILSDLWEGILKAVPKKKTSYMKKRHRQLAGKALKDVNAVNTCPGCGKPKKAHHLCPYCVAEIKESWKQSAKQAAQEVMK